MTVLLFVVLAAGFAPAAHAQLGQGQQNVQQVAQAAGVGGTTDLPTIIGRLINIVLGFLGIVLLGLILYAGFLWMTAGGSEEQIQKAKAYIRNAVIGLVIIASAWGITFFILQALFGAGFGGGTGGPGGAGGPGGGFPTGAGSLGGGIIESHIPQRNAVNVPRNTSIIITFKRPIQLASLIQGYNDNGTPANLADDTVTTGVNDTSVKIYQTQSGVAQALTTSQVRVAFTQDRRTFVFRPVQLLGASNADTGYTVQLMGGQAGVLLEDGTLAFGGAFASGYTWQFEVGTFVDTTPPKVESVIPMAGGQYARNIVIQITFDEAVDPTATTGFVTNGQGFQNIRVHGGGLSTLPLDGEYRISNRYRTVEFIPAQMCGRNSCGRDIFCLPGATAVDVIARAATLNGAGPDAQFLASGFDGVVDVVGNSLDGNGDGSAQGQGADDYAWAFGTSDTIQRTAPVIEDTVPPADPADPGQSNIDPFAPVTVRFDSQLQSSTVNTDNILIVPKEPQAMADTFWWNTGLRALTSANAPVATPADIAAKSQVIIDHRMYASSTEYDPYLLSGIQNTYQNCFNPASGPACPLGPGGPNCCQGVRQGTACVFP